MQQPQKRNKIHSITTRDIWQIGLDTLRATWRQTVIVAISGLLVPQLLVNAWFDFQSPKIVDEIRHLSQTSHTQNLAFTNLLQPALPFLVQFGFVALCMTALAFGSYLALVYIAVEHQRDQADSQTPKATQAFGERGSSAATAMRVGVALALRRGLALALTCFAFLFVGQIALAPAILAAIMGLVIPVILVAERKGMWSSLRDALALRYIKDSRYNGWSVLFSLLSLGATLYIAILLIAMLSDFLLRADEVLGLTRGFWAWTFSGVPFGPVYLAASLVEAVLLTSIFSLFPALTTALYFQVRGGRIIRQDS